MSRVATRHDVNANQVFYVPLPGMHIAKGSWAGQQQISFR